MTNDYVKLVLIMAGFMAIVAIGCVFPATTSAFIAGLIATSQA